MLKYVHNAFCNILKLCDFSVQNAETVKFLSNAKYGQDDLLRAKQQLESELGNLQQERRNMVRYCELNLT